MEKRIANIHRRTGETDITMSLNLDGRGKAEISTGIGFFDHMMDAFTRHGLFDMSLKAKGDLHVDGHHTVEDTGIVLGSAIKEAVGDKKGIRRYGFFVLPMDEALILCMNLHFRILSGTNAHHIIEGMFKCFSKALDMATQKENRITDVLSTKGSL